MDAMVLVVAGFALLAVAGWSRAGRSPNARWWVRGQFAQRAVLLVMPGLGVMCLAAAGMVGYERGDGGLRLWLALPAAVGAVAAVWGALLLPVPGLVQPRWLREAPRDGGRRA